MGVQVRLDLFPTLLYRCLFTSSSLFRRTSLLFIKYICETESPPHWGVKNARPTRVVEGRFCLTRPSPFLWESFLRLFDRIGPLLSGVVTTVSTTSMPRNCTNRLLPPNGVTRRKFWGIRVKLVLFWSLRSSRVDSLWDVLWTGQEEFWLFR